MSPFGKCHKSFLIKKYGSFASAANALEVTESDLRNYLLGKNQKLGKEKVDHIREKLKEVRPSMMPELFK